MKPLVNRMRLPPRARRLRQPRGFPGL